MVYGLWSIVYIVYPHKKLPIFAKKNMLRTIIFIILFLSTSFCSRDPLKFRKSQTIPEKKLITILAEMHLMDAMTNHYEFYYRFDPKDTIDINGAILEKYGYSRAEFDSSIVNYTKRPDLYESLYNDVLMKLNYMLDTIQNNDPQFEKERMELSREKQGLVR
jgi:hypothetical protein